MAASVSGNTSIDLLLYHPFSMPLKRNSIDLNSKESDEGATLPYIAGNTKRSSNTPCTVSPKKDSYIHQNKRLLYPRKLAMEYEVSGPKDTPCALKEQKSEPHTLREKRQKNIDSDFLLSSRVKKVNKMQLNSWLGTLQDDTKTRVSHAAKDVQRPLGHSEPKLLSVERAADARPLKPFTAVSSCTDVFLTPSTGDNQAQESLLDSVGNLAQQEASQMLEKDKIKVDTDRRMLRLNSEGKLGSSPSRSSWSKIGSSSQYEQCSNPNKLIVVLKYGQNEETKRRFAKIVDCSLDECKSIPQSEHSHKVGRYARRNTPYKTLHPFFISNKKLRMQADAQIEHSPSLGRAASQGNEQQLRKCAVTPGKLRAQRRDYVEASEQMEISAPILKIPVRSPSKFDTKRVMWPSRINMHVRGIQNVKDKASSFRSVDNNPFKGNRKLKGTIVTVPQKEGIIWNLSQDFRSSVLVNKLESTPVSAIRTLPSRQITTGPDLRNWFSSRLFGLKDAASPLMQRDGIFVPNEKLQKHPALKRLCNEVENTLTPFDEFTCESTMWTSKYAPKKADQVLQSEDHAPFIRDWLRSLTLQTTQKDKNVSSVPALVNDRNSTSRRRRFRKKRKRDTLEGFITSSEDESSNRGKRSETASENSLSPSLDRNGKLISNTSGIANVRNSILISGPHGCGKTAAVYAAAEELGFEVFEINSGSRRSGRDLLDKVGEMAENHLVQSVPELSILKKVDAHGAEELDNSEMIKESLSQKSMKTFFTAKPRPITSKNVVNTSHEEDGGERNGKSQGREPRQQKQSLILLEEADILFEEDKQFWPTVVSLLDYSKRPVILTCTDESLIPQDLMNFQATLRFTPPPLDVTVSYLMLLAGNEGHKLTWDTVSGIYDQTNNDLRASIMTLNFWCQMGIGDKKGGLNWMVNRWPAGVDLDQHGRKIRVVSNESYQSVTGLLPSDLCFADNSVNYERDCEVLRDVCENRSVDLELLFNNINGHENDRNMDSKQHLQDNLSTYQELVEAQIMSETFSSIDCFTREQLAPTERCLSDKILADKPEGVTLLSVEPVEGLNSLTTHLGVASILLSCRAYQKRKALKSRSIDPAIVATSKAAQSGYRKSCVPNHGLLLASALNPLAPEPNTYSVLTSQTQSMLATEVAPYVRDISAFDQALEVQRASRLASFGGRLTRAARSVVEGVERGKVRRERWIPGLNLVEVLQTAGHSWRNITELAKEEEANMLRKK